MPRFVRQGGGINVASASNCSRFFIDIHLRNNRAGSREQRDREDARLLESLNVGDQVAFRAEKVDGQFTVTVIARPVK